MISQAERLGVTGLSADTSIIRASHRSVPSLIVNTDDFVESCTGLTEHHDGSLEIIWWQTAVAEPSRAEAEPVPAAA